MLERNNAYSFTGRVRFSEIDHTEKITLPGIVNYFQDCSIFQSESLGLGVDYLAEHGRAWVLSAWQVVVERYPRLGEAIGIYTWATGFKGVIGYRNFCMTDEEGTTLAYANSVWSYMDMRKGRPVRPAREEVAAYGIGEPLEMDYADRKIRLPEGFREKSSFPVRKYHIDTNEHVNNCQYVQMALEALDKEILVHQMRAEYKKSAVYRDVIVPRVTEEGDRITAALCDVDGTPYAVVEFQTAGK